MNLHLTTLEARVIGSLVEKAITTPDQYPLSLNALTNACNQKSNRDPVLELDEGSVQQALDSLARKHLIMEKSGFGSRVPKYQHRFCNTGFGSLEFSAIQTAILCELLLRGPQTPGELRSRASRMAAVHDVNEIEAVLNELATREDGPFVARLPREPGKRETRYAHLFSGPVESAGEELPSEAAAEAAAAEQADTSLQERLSLLEERIEQLEREIDVLKGRPPRHG